MVSPNFNTWKMRLRRWSRRESLTKPGRRRPKLWPSGTSDFHTFLSGQYLLYWLFLTHALGHVQAGPVPCPGGAAEEVPARAWWAERDAAESWERRRRSSVLRGERQPAQAAPKGWTQSWNSDLGRTDETWTLMLTCKFVCLSVHVRCRRLKWSSVALETEWRRSAASAGSFTLSCGTSQSATWCRSKGKRTLSWTAGWMWVLPFSGSSFVHSSCCCATSNLLLCVTQSSIHFYWDKITCVSKHFEQTKNPTALVGRNVEQIRTPSHLPSLVGVNRKQKMERETERSGWQARMSCRGNN